MDGSRTLAPAPRGRGLLWPQPPGTDASEAKICPSRPASLDENDLGYRRRGMVRWFDPHQLVDTARRVLVSGMFGAYSDQRDLQSLVPSRVMDRSDLPEVWFDYVSDLGDGFDSTYTIAYLVAQPTLALAPPPGSSGEGATTERGRILVMGGDQVYPVPTREGYQNRLMGPYRSAWPCAPDAPPDLLAVPGSHDWYDGLVNFTGVFCRSHAIGAWRTSQPRSYWACRLPHGWWLWGIDIQFGSFLDEAQLEYFAEVAVSHVDAGDRIILVLAKEVESGRDDSEIVSDRTVEFLEREIIEATGASVAIYLKSGRHYYSRYVEVLPDPAADREPRHHIRAGGGGAFLHPTHHLGERVELPGSTDPVTYERKAVYPSVERSIQLRKRVFFLPFYNVPQIVAFGSVFAVVGLLLGLHLPGRHVRLGAGDIWRYLWGSPLLALLLGMAAALVGGLVAFAHDAKPPILRTLIGTVYSAYQVSVLGFVLIFASTLTGGSGPGATALFFAIVTFVGGFASSLALSSYLWLANKFGLHDNEAYAPLHHKDNKGFLRFHLDRDGVLHLFPISVDRVGRAWRADPEAAPDAPWIVPEGPAPVAALIEDPLRYPG